MRVNIPIGIVFFSPTTLYSVDTIMEFRSEFVTKAILQFVFFPQSNVFPL